MTFRTHHHLLVLLLCVLSSACTAARLRRESALRLRDADALAARGCHGCLTDALSIYQGLQPSAADMRLSRVRRVFRVSLLLALREKELGLPARDHLERARRLAASTVAPDVSRERVELADLLPWDLAGLSRETQHEQSRRLSAARDRIVARLTRRRMASDDAELDVYLDLALGCSGRLAPVDGFKPEELVSSLPSSPLLAYRLGACGRAYAGRLQPLVDADHRFAEVYWWLGRYRVRGRGLAGGPIGTDRDVRHALLEAHRAFTASAAITMELANATRLTSYREALPLYERVTAAVPDHQDALFGAGLCHSYLGAPREAIVVFTRLLGLGRWLVGDSLYWRAWNRHQLQQLDLAWADIEEAKKTVYNTNVYTLAGVIAYDRSELDVARSHLETGLSLDARNCTAAWYLGLVHAAQERWMPSGETFERAAVCYHADADDARAQLALARDSDAPAETKASQIAAAEATIEESVRQEATSAYNAAFGFVRGADSGRARRWLERALAHADMKARAEELLAFLDRR